MPEVNHPADYPFGNIPLLYLMCYGDSFLRYNPIILSKPTIKPGF